MELREYWYVIRKRILMILFVPIVAALVSGYYVSHKIPIYQVQETMLLDETGVSNGTPDTPTYIGMLQSQYFTDKMDQRTQSQYPLPALQSVSYTFTGKLMTMSIMSTDPVLSSKLLDTIARVVSSTTDRLIPNINGGTVIDPPWITPVPLHRKRDVILTSVMALIAGLGLAFLREYLDMRIKSEVDLVRFLNIPSLGGVQEYKRVKSKPSR